MMSTSMKSGLWAAALSLSIAFGCGGGDGEGGAGGKTTTTSSGGTGGSIPTYGTSACRACVTTACADELDACKADPECPTFLACLDACALASGGDADPACVASCPVGSGSESKKAANELNLCREKGAGVACTECGLTTTITYTSPVLNQTCPNPSTETDPCYVCTDEKCCETYLTCHDDAGCQAVKSCINGCAASDHACVKACTEQHAAGSDVLGPYNACAVVLCLKECGNPNPDACESCFYGDCGDAYAYYMSAPGGLALQFCIDACPIDDTTCDQQCYAAYPEAFSRFEELASCVSVVCKGKC